MILFAIKQRYKCVKANKVIRKEMRLPLLSFLRNFTHGERLCTKIVLCLINKFINEILPVFVFNYEVAELPNAIKYLGTYFIVVQSLRDLLVEHLVKYPFINLVVRSHLILKKK